MHDRVESLSLVSSRVNYLWSTKPGEELDWFELLQRVWPHIHQRTSCSCSVDGQLNELWSGLFLLYACVISTCTLLMWVLDYVINLEQLHIFFRSTPAYYPCEVFFFQVLFAWTYCIVVYSCKGACACAHVCVSVCGLKWSPTSLEYVSTHAVDEMKFTNTQLHRIWEKVKM